MQDEERLERFEAVLADLQSEQAVVHGDHILPGSGIDLGIDLRHLILADHVADGRGHRQDLKRRNHAAVCGRYQLLGDHGI